MEQTADAHGNGSSPRVRGKRPGAEGMKRDAGLIPACAGKTLVRHMFITQRPAHPRVCGENASPETTLVYLQGSSPRVRGKRP